MYIDHDLERSPLLIKTNSEPGSDEFLRVYFFTADEESAGGFSSNFKLDPKFWLIKCSDSYTDFPHELPSETDKVWRVSLSRISGVRRIVVQCNDVEVLNARRTDE